MELQTRMVQTGTCVPKMASCRAWITLSLIFKPCFDRTQPGQHEDGVYTLSQVLIDAEDNMLVMGEATEPYDFSR